MTTAVEGKNAPGRARELSEKELDRLEQRLEQVLTDLAPVEGQLDVDSEFEKVMFSNTDVSDTAIDDVREMSRRFGPRLVQLLGFPAVPGRCSIYVNDGGMRAELEIDPPASDGKPVVPQCGDRVSFDANAGLFYAKESGRVSIDGAAIDIEDLHIIKQDVDISVGHVNFPGELVVRGWVRSGLSGGEAVIVTAGKGIVIGGKIYAGKRVEVKELGTGSGEPTVVQLGISPENLQSLSKLKNRLQAAQKAMADAELALQQSGLSSDAIQAKAVGDDGRRLMKLVKTVVVLHTRLEKLKAEESAFLDSMKNQTGGVLDVRGRVHPGVRVQIGTASYQVTKPLSWVRFKYDKAMRRIKVLSLG